VPRKRRTRLPSAVFKALVPKPLRKRRARRAAPASVGRLKAARASARSASKIARTATSVSRTVKPSTRKATAGSASSRTTKPRTTKPRTSAVRKPVRSSARGKAASTPGKGTWRRARFTGVAGSRSYRVYVPRGLRRTTKVPLLLALHGCTQNGLDFAAGTRFNDLADKHKFVVVYPEQSRRHNGLRCWNWFRSAHQFRAQGEPAILAGIVRRVSQEAALWRIDAERVYVAGISAGGGMALVLAATYPELFAAVGVHSAPPYRSASGPANALAAMQGVALRGAAAQVPADAIGMEGMPPLIVFQGTADSTVRRVNAQRVADQWLSYHRHGGTGRAAAIGPPRTATTPPTRPASARARRGYQVNRWYVGGRKVLEVWVVDGLGHAWSGGSSSGSFSDARGPRASTAMWKFFGAHRSVTAAAVLVS